jgi:hypothetical protein
MAWNGSFLVLSILVHIILLGGATLLVLQVVQSRKEKLKFTAPPPNANPSAEHKVKPNKKTSAPAPSVTKRITTTALNAQIALPTVDISSTAPDVMASVMSGMGGQGLGGGVGGAAGMASMPMTGLTAFGFRGGGNSGLTGNFYDLKQTPDHKEIKMSIPEESKILTDFFQSGWNDSFLMSHYFKAPDPLRATQFYVPVIPSTKAPEAFGVEKFVKPSYWLIHYKGNVTASKTTRVRFRGRGDNIIAVRFDGQNVLLNTLQDAISFEKLFPNNQPRNADRSILSYGAWINLEKNKSYPMEVIFSDYGGYSSMFLCVEEENPSEPYKVTNDKTNITLYPLFQLARDVPLPPHTNSMNLITPNSAIPVDLNPTAFYAK